MAERFGGWLLIAALILLPFGRSVELPVLLAALLGVVAVIRGARPWREPAGGLSALLFLGYWLPELLSAFTAVAPKRSGKIASPPSPKVKASGGEPTNTSLGVTPRISRA